MTSSETAPAVLFLSYDGLLEPLGESQVYGYLRHLSDRYRIFLITYEKPRDKRNPNKLNSMAQRCQQAGIHWLPLTYHKRPTLFATGWDVLCGIAFGIWLIRSKRIAMIHARSYVSATIAGVLKKLTGVPFLFDTRGFWVDERVEGGIWPSDSVLVRWGKATERWLFRNADFITCLTEPARGIITKENLQINDARVKVIPTCVDLDIFVSKKHSNRKNFTLGYVGSIGTWYRFDQVLEVIKILFEIVPESRFVIVNLVQQDEVRALLDDCKLEKSRVQVLGLNHAEVANAISAMDAGIVFRKQVKSSLGSSPTRLAEFLACGKPVMCNHGLGGMETLLGAHQVGVGIARYDYDSLKAGLLELLAMARDPRTAQRCRKAAVALFSKSSGAEAYHRIYSFILSQR